MLNMLYLLNMNYSTDIRVSARVQVFEYHAYMIYVIITAKLISL